MTVMIGGESSTTCGTMAGFGGAGQFPGTSYSEIRLLPASATNRCVPSVNSPVGPNNPYWLVFGRQVWGGAAFGNCSHKPRMRVAVKPFVKGSGPLKNITR